MQLNSLKFCDCVPKTACRSLTPTINFHVEIVCKVENLNWISFDEFSHFAPEKPFFLPILPSSLYQVLGHKQGLGVVTDRDPLIS